MKYVWEDLPKPLNCFTIRSATMVNLNNGKIVSNYAANTKIVVVQKCVTPKGTYYRTNEAAHHYLNYAFRASAFGLPDEKAPSAHSPKSNSLGKVPLKSKPVSRTKPGKKQTSSKKSSHKVASPKGGEAKQQGGWLKRLFRRKNGKAKNS